MLYEQLRCASARLPWLVCLTLGACASSTASHVSQVETGPPPRGVVSSETSAYSPTLRLNADVTLGADSLVVAVVDGGVLSIAGMMADDSPIMMTRLTMVAFVATSDGFPVRPFDDAGSLDELKPWHALGTGSAILVGTDLRFGE